MVIFKGCSGSVRVCMDCILIKNLPVYQTTPLFSFLHEPSNSKLRVSGLFLPGMQYLRQEIFTHPFLYSLFFPFLLCAGFITVLPFLTSCGTRGDYSSKISHGDKKREMHEPHGRRCFVSAPSPAGCREGRLAVSISKSSQNKTAATTSSS